MDEKKVNKDFVPSEPSTPKESNTVDKGFNPPEPPKPKPGNQTKRNVRNTKELESS